MYDKKCMCTTIIYDKCVVSKDSISSLCTLLIEPHLTYCVFMYLDVHVSNLHSFEANMVDLFNV